MGNGIDNIRFVASGRGWSRPGVVFTAAAIALLGAFLIAFPPKLLDVLWICTFCLTIASMFICFAAKSSSDLAGFVPLIFGLTLLRLAIQASTARSIIRDEPAGVLVSLTGSVLATGWPITAVLISLLLAIIFVAVVFASCRRITQASIGYIKRILPLKRMGIETDLRLGVIDDNQAGALACRVVAESRFFANMYGTSLLMRAEAAICIFILLAALMLPMLNPSVEYPVKTQSWTTTAPLVVALSLFALVPGTVVATACGALMNKDTLALTSNSADGTPSADRTKKITVIALDSQTEEDAAAQSNSPAADANEQIAEFEPQFPPPSRGSLPVPMDISCRNAKEYYEKLSNLICTIDTRPRVILLASDKMHSLPVTVAVNIAIRLAQKRRKVLLVDTDDERNAIAQVFDLQPDELQKKVKPSALENLALCCVPAAKLQAFLCKSYILDRFGATLIYTPNIEPVKVSAADIAARPGVFYFVDELKTDTPKSVTQKLDFCSWLCLMPSIQSVLDRNA